MIESTMKRKLVFLLILFAVLALAVLVVRVILGGRSAKTGVLKVQTTPTASVFLDNKLLGRSPYEDKVDAGEYTIRLVPETTTGEAAAWQGPIRIAPNLLTYINASLADSEFATAVDSLWLERISGKGAEISVTTNPDGATVVIDGATRGVTPLTVSDVAAGDHTVTLASPGFVSRSIKMKTTAGYKLNASVKLALSPDAGLGAEATPSPTTPGGKVTPKATPTKTATSSASTVPDPPKPFARIKDTPTGFLRVRMEPSTSATEAARVNPGEKYTILDEKSGWYQIKYDGTNLGWIAGQYAEKTE